MGTSRKATGKEPFKNPANTPEEAKGTFVPSGNKANSGKLYRPAKGEKLNPNGRPKGMINAKEIIKYWMNLTVKENGKRLNKKTGKMIDSGKMIVKKGPDGEPITYFDAAILKQIEKALKSDTTAFNALLDRLEGKPKQVNEIQVPVGSIVSIGGQQLSDE